MSSVIFEITHDSLAAKIWEKVSAEEKTLIEVKNFITNSAVIYKTRKVLLTKLDLAYIAPYESKLTLDEETAAFINRSKRFYRNQKISTISMIAVIIAGLVIGIIVINNANRKAVAEKQNALIETKRAEAAQANAIAQKEMAVKASTAAKLAEEFAKENKAKADTNAILAEKRSEELKITLRSLEAKQAELDKTNKDLKSSNKNLVEEQTKNSRQIFETKNTLENTKQLYENPTLALKEAIDLYDTVNNTELRTHLKKNAFDAFNKIIYINELSLSDPVQDIAISYDGKTVLIADSTNIPKVWNIAGKSKKSLYGHFKPVTIVAAAPNKAHFVTVENKREAIFWGPNYEYMDTANYKDEIKTIKYINGGNELLIGFKNGKMAITDLRGKIDQIIHDENIIDLEEIIVTEQPGYNFITRSSDDTIRLWRNIGNTKKFNNTIIFDDSRTTGAIFSMALSPAGDQLSLGCEKGIFCAHSLIGKKQEFGFEIFIPGITKIAFKNNQELIVSTVSGNSFIYDVERKEYKEVKGYYPNTRITHLQTFHDGYFITVGSNKNIKIWNDEANKLFFARSIDNTSKQLINNNFILDIQNTKWNLKDNSGSIVSFDYDKIKNRRYRYSKSYDQYYWDSAYYTKNDSIEIVSPTNEYIESNSYQTLSIVDDTATLATIRIGDRFQADKKIRSKLTIRSATISDCKKFILIEFTERSGKFTYYLIYPTFQGLYDIVKNKNLLKIKK